MRGIFLLVCLAGTSLAGQPLDWSRGTAAALELATDEAKPVLVHWVAGSSAASFQQELDRLFSTWPAWTAQLAMQVIPLRLRSWEAPWPLTMPPLPGDGKTSVLGLAKPGSATWLIQWLAVPPVLEFSHAAQAGGLVLDDPYAVNVAEYGLEGQARKFVRLGEGPEWEETSAEGTRLWKEEGYLGALLVLRLTTGPIKAAFPLVEDWCFLYNPVNQSWTPWSRVLVKPR